MCFRIILTAMLLVPGMGALALAEWGYPTYSQPTTAAGAAATGAANVIQAQGSYNLQTSQAAINAEQARSMNIANNLQYTQTYYEQKAIHDQYMQAQYAKDKRSAADYKRYAAAAAPKRMSYSQLDPVTGALAWPLALTAPDFNDDRQGLDKLFAERAKGALGYQNVMQLRKLADEMNAQLKANITTIPTEDYIPAMDFLSSLTNEARYPAH